MLNNKVLIVYVTRNNGILLQHSFESFRKNDPGYECDYLIIDHESEDKGHLNALDTLSRQHKVVTYENNRVEVSFNKAYHDNKQYEHYFFMHDDTCANKDNWLKVFVDRLQSNYVENIIKDTPLSNLKIGRVGAMHQPYRNYSSILGYPVQCLFLEHIIREMYQDMEVPKIFKFADPDRVLVSNECLSRTNGLRNIGSFKELEGNELFNKLKQVLDKYLPYYDEGIPPLDKYPPGNCWNKLTMTSEFLNSVQPLMTSFRTVGLEGDGFLENIHGYDVPWGHNYVHHYGAPNMKQFLAKQMNSDPNEISKHLKNKVFLMKTDKLIKEYFERKRANG